MSKGSGGLGIWAAAAAAVVLAVSGLGPLVVGGSASPVSMTFNLQDGVNYVVSPPQLADPVQSITNARELEASIRQQCGSNLRLEVAKWIPVSSSPLFSSGNFVQECYPLGSTIVPVTSPTGLCWNYPDDLTWGEREGIQIRVLGGDCSFTWQGMEVVPTDWSGLSLGSQLASVPWVPYQPGPRALDLMNAIGFQNVASVYRYLQASDGLQCYTGRMGDCFTNWPIVSGDGYFVAMNVGAPPGTPQNGAVLQGTLYRDTNPANGSRDPGEPGLAARFMRIVDSTLHAFYALTSAQGTYELRVPAGDVVLDPVFHAGELFTPPYRPLTVQANEVVGGLDFGRSRETDLGVALYPRHFAPASSPCSGAEMELCVRYENLGDTGVPDARVRLQLPPASDVTYVSASTTANCSAPPDALVPPDASNLLLWHPTGGLDPGERCTVCARFAVAPSPPPRISASASVHVDSSLAQDGVTGGISRNVQGYERDVACSEDPNDAQVSARCGSGGFVAPGETLTYLVRFQNSGTTTVTNATVAALLDRDLDESTLEVIDSSHPLSSVTLVPTRYVKFSMSGTSIPPSGQGYLLFSARLKPGLPEGTTLSGRGRVQLVSSFFTSFFTNAVLSIISSDGVLTGCDNCPLDPQACGPSLTLQSHTVADACNGTGSGGGNAVVEPGETATVPVRLENNGTAGTTGVVATLTTSTPGVTVTGGSSGYPNLDAGQSAVGNTPFEIQVDPGVPCGTVIQFNVAATANEGSWNGGSFTILVGAPGFVTVPYNSTDVPRPIPNLATITSALSVASTDPVLDVNVGVSITHPFTADLILTLIGPNGTRIVLASQRGTGSDYTNTVFDDEAATPISAGNAPFTGSFRPEAPLSVLDGIPGAGTWALEARDTTTLVAGTLTAWSIEIFTTRPPVCSFCTPAPPGPPGEVADFRAQDDERFVWSPTPSALTYDVVRGLLSGLPVGPSGGDEQCFESGISGTSTSDSTLPGYVTGGYWYLVQAVNGNGRGPFGNEHANPGPAGNGPARVTATCP